MLWYFVSVKLVVTIDVVCHGRCDSAVSCGNKVEKSLKSIYPQHGGAERDNNGVVAFSNTCIVDNWFSLLFLMSKEHSKSFETLMSLSTDLRLTQALECIKMANFSNGKNI